MSDQIPFELASDPDYSFERFKTDASNQALVQSLRHWSGEDFPVRALCGPEGSGKTHLSAAWLQEQPSGLALSTNAPPDYAALKGRAIMIDDAPTCADTTLFSVINMALNGEITALLLTGREPPKAWDVAIPDLASRLKNIPVYTLSQPDDEVLSEIMRDMFEQRDRQVKADLVQYLTNRYSRDVAVLQNIVDELDYAARKEKKDLTRSFASKYLKSRQG